MQTENTTPTPPSMASFMIAVGELMEKFGRGPYWSVDQDSDGQLIINTGLTSTSRSEVKPMD